VLTAKEFFELVRNIFENWDRFKTLLKFPDEVPTTDVVYAVAAVIMGVETLRYQRNRTNDYTHEKIYYPTLTNNWTEELVWEDTRPWT
jgi:hypothetical protein